MKTWGIGIIGCGSIADFHMAAIREIAQAKLCCVSSRKERRAREAAAREGCAWTTDYRELLARPEVELVCVTTSSGSHGRVGADVLRAGKHLLVEKPMAMTAEEAELLIRLAEERGVAVSVVSQNRMKPVYRTVKKLIDEGKLGKLLLLEVRTPYLRTQAYYDSADWRGTLAEDGGALMNQGIHAIDLLLWMGGGVRAVYGKTATQTHAMEAEDMGLAIVQFQSGALGTILASTSIQPGFPQSVHLYGEQGTVAIEGETIVHWTVPDVPQPDIASAGLHSGASDPLRISHEYHKWQIADMLESIGGGRKPAITGADGRNAVRLIHAIYDSSRNGKEILI